jgi:hypothetical protein
MFCRNVRCCDIHGADTEVNGAYDFTMRPSVWLRCQKFASFIIIYAHPACRLLSHTAYAILTPTQTTELEASYATGRTDVSGGLAYR